jgi:hypothetical protein
VTELSLNRCDIAGFLDEVKNNSPLGKIAFMASFEAPSNSSFNKLQRGVLADLHLPEADN